MKQLFAVALALLSFSLFAQRAADHEFKLNGVSKDVFFHKATGKPIVKTSAEYLGIDPESKSVEWRVKRNNLAKLDAISDKEVADYYEIPVSKLAIINHSLVNIHEGKVILNAEDHKYKKVVNYHLLFEDRKIFIEGVGEGMKIGYLVDLLTNEVLWSSEIGKSSLMQKMSTGTEGADMYPIVNFMPIIHKNRLFFKQGSELVAFDMANGNIAWREKCKPADFLIHDASNTIVIMEQKTGMMSSALAQGGYVSFDKTVYLFDIDSGENRWKKPLKLEEELRYAQIWGDELLVVDKATMNFYDIKSGDTRWKKPFKAKRISSVVEENNQLVVNFKNRFIQHLNPSTGEAKMKKPLTMEFEIEDKEVDEGEVDLDRSNPIELEEATLYPNLEKGNMFIHYKFEKKWAYVPSLNFKINEAESQLGVICYGNFRIYSLKSRSIKRKVIKVKNKEYINRIALIPGKGYFVYGKHDYAFVDFNGTLTKNETFKIPGEAGRKLMNTAAVLGQTAALGAAVDGAADMTRGYTEAISGVVGATYSGDPKFNQLTSKGINRMNEGENKLVVSAYAFEVLGSLYQDRFEAFKESESFAYFFTKNDAGDKVLHEVVKAGGEIKDSFLFKDNTPQYVVDDLSGAVYYVHKDTLYIFN